MSSRVLTQLRLISALCGNHVIIDTLHWFHGFAHNNPKGMCRDVARQQLLFVHKEVVFYFVDSLWKAFTKEMCRCYGQWTFGFDLRWAVASQALTLYMCIPSFLICGNFFKERRPRPSLNRSHAFWPHNGEQGCTSRQHSKLNVCVSYNLDINN